MKEKAYPFPEFPYADVDWAEKLYYLAKLKTREPSKKETSFPKVMERPLSLKYRRAEMFGEYQKARSLGDKLGMEAVKEKAMLWDEAYRQFYNNQREVSVDLGKWGVSKVKCVEINLTNDENAPVAILAPGISGGLEAIGEIPMALAMSGRRVKMFSWPEAYDNRKTSVRFAKAVKNNQGLEPHVEFAKAVIKKLAPSGEFEVWGKSFGAAMMAMMLKRGYFYDQITKAVLVTPAGLIELDKTKLGWNIANEAVEAMRIGFKDTLRINVSNKQTILKTDVEFKRRAEICEEVLKRTLGIINWYDKTMKIKEGGKILVVSAKGDKVARTKFGLNKLPETAQTLEIDGGHMAPELKSEELINKIDAVMK